MPCLMTDQPLRVRLTKTGVVHAGAIQDYGGFTRSTYAGPGIRGTSKYVPKQKRVAIACKWRMPEEGYSEHVISNKENITCKSCMKKIGMMDDIPLSEQRFVIRKKSTGEFYKNTSTRCSVWSDHVTDAFIFKKKHTASSKCKVGKWVDEDGNFTTWDEYNKAGRKGSHVRIKDPDLEVRAIKITVE